mmetsp:Transcript_5972/g.7521  ORF Transcript_5972/g.7521 Transcript_5972/m.7521 type:complete len:87 (-) Transcript_5972:424-684(-)
MLSRCIVGSTRKECANHWPWALHHTLKDVVFGMKNTKHYVKLVLYIVILLWKIRDLQNRNSFVRCIETKRNDLRIFNKIKAAYRYR